MKKKILIINGGGVFGCIPAHFLSFLPKDKQTLAGVDLLSGCSIGGILACAYASGKNFSDIDKLFQQNADKCFTKRFAARINILANPTYRDDTIEKVLKDIIGKCTLGDVRKVYPDLDLIIPTLNITDDKYKVFDNIEHDDDDIPLQFLGAITAAAPSYFGGKLYKDKCYVDGGLIEVAPLLTATTALKQKRNIPFDQMDILMLGTGQDIDQHPLTYKDYNGLNLLGLATQVIVPYVTLSNYMATCYWGKNIGYNSFQFFNPCITDGALDQVDRIPQCIKQCDKYKDDFLKVWNEWLNR